MQRKITAILKKTNTLPFLFIGSGLSRRYLDLGDWEGLLTIFANLASDNEYAYKLYKQQAEVQGYKEGILPKVAELIENDFNQVWYSDERFIENRSKHQKSIEDDISPFKIEIADYMKDMTGNALEKYKGELELFEQTGKKSIAGIITTNYDLFLESMFSDFTSYIGQEELIFSPIQGISEIYKIHGCATKPDSIVINEKDYLDFSDKYAYLAAKLMTIFLEHPIIFLGYSVSDKNIEEILKSIVRCLSQEHLEQLKERLIFIEYCDPGMEDISIYSKSFVGQKSIDMTRIKLNDFSVLYEALIENKAKYNVSMLRRIKEDIYDLVVTNKPTSKLRVIGLEEEDKLDQVEVVVGVGVLSEFGQKGYLGVGADEIYEDIVLDNGAFDKARIINDTLPNRLKTNSKNLPIFKYIKDYGETLPGIVEECIKTDFDQLLSNTIKKNRHKYQDIYHSIEDVLDEFSLEKSLQIIPHLMKTDIDVEELNGFLIKIFTEKPDILEKGKSKPGVRTDLKRVIRIYDFLKFSE